VKVNRAWRYVYRAVDQHGQVIDVLLSARRDAEAARRFFTRARRTLKVIPIEVVTDAAPVYPGVLEELLPAAWHHVEQYANNPIEHRNVEVTNRTWPPWPRCWPGGGPRHVLSILTGRAGGLRLWMSAHPRNAG
jgi:transposase-like protein